MTLKKIRHNEFVKKRKKKHKTKEIMLVYPRRRKKNRTTFHPVRQIIPCTTRVSIYRYLYLYLYIFYTNWTLSTNSHINQADLTVNQVDQIILTIDY